MLAERLHNARPTIRRLACVSASTSQKLEDRPSLGSSHAVDQSSEIKVDVFLGVVAGRAMLLTNAHGAAIALKDDRGIGCRAVAGEIGPQIGSRIDVQSGLSGTCLRSKRVMQCDNASADPKVDRECCSALEINSVIAAPIIQRGSAIGLIEVFSRRPYAFDTSDCFVVERLAHIAARMVSEKYGDNNGSEVTGKVGDGLQPEKGLDSYPTGSMLPPKSSAARLTHAEKLLFAQSVGRNFSGTGISMILRGGVWLMAIVLLAGSLWLTFGNSSQWQSKAPAPRAIAPQSASPDKSHLNPSGSSASFLPMKNDSTDGIRKRAEDGSADAELELGTAYATARANGESIEAVKWLTRSANHGNVTAASALGAFYWSGRGVVQDYSDAYMWSAIAEAEGDEASNYRLAILRSRMSPIELAQAKFRAADWLYAHRKYRRAGGASTR